MIKMLTDFANIEEFTYDTTATFMRQNNIILTERGEKQGFDLICLTEKSDLPFSFIEMPGEAVNTHREKMFYWRSDKNEKQLAACLSESQLSYRGFLDSCIEGSIDIKFLNNRLSQIGAKNLIASSIDNRFRVMIELDLRPSNIETHLDIYAIVNPLWRGEGEEFSRIKKCKNCGNYFDARSRKAEFCAVTCKNAFYYKQDKK